MFLSFFLWKLIHSELTLNQVQHKRDSFQIQCQRDAFVFLFSIQAFHWLVGGLYISCFISFAEKKLQHKIPTTFSCLEVL